MDCKECPYFWYDYDDEGNCISERPYCHWVSRCPDDVAPCEEYEYEAIEYEYEEIEYEYPEYEEAWGE